jgi:4-amino-4-deoxy-L-arabinose transferase-like glycosyltransferase
MFSCVQPLVQSLRGLLVRARAYPLFWLTLAALFMVFVEAGRTVFSSNDEARFAVLAQDILTRGRWLYPEVSGAVYHNKPLLLAWLIALCSAPLGEVSQLTAVLPSALAALGTIGTIYLFTRHLFGPEAARIAALATMTTQGVYLYARLPMPDMLMTGFITASLAMLWLTLRGNHPRAWIGFYGFTAAAFWAKGPAGLVPLIVAAIVVAARLGSWRALNLARGVALVVALTSPWWVRELMSEAATVRRVLVSDYLFWYVPTRVSVTSLVTPMQHAFAITSPWVLVVPAVLVQARRALRQPGQQRDALLFVLVWLTVLFGLVAVSQQQRLRYYLPLVPPLAVLIGWWVARGVRSATTRHLIPWKVYAATAAVLLVATVAFVSVRREWPRDVAVALPSPIELLVIVVAMAGAIGALAYGIRHRKLPRAFVAAAVCSAVVLVVGYHGQIDRQNQANDYLRLRAALAPAAEASPLVATWGVADLPVAFYFARPSVTVSRAPDLAQLIRNNPRAIAILSESASSQLQDRHGLRFLFEDELAFRRISVFTSR